MNPIFLVWIVLIAGLFYFMMVKPQKAARSRQMDLMEHLAPGAEVRTNAHILGTVTEVGDEWAIIETTPGVKLKIGKPAIVAIILPDEPDEAEESDEVDETDASEDGHVAVADAVDAVPVVTDAVPAGADAAAETAAADVEAKTEVIAKSAEPATKA